MRIASASWSRSARSSASILLMSILAGYRVIENKSDCQWVGIHLCFAFSMSWRAWGSISEWPLDAFDE